MRIAKVTANGVYHMIEEVKPVGGESVMRKICARRVPFFDERSAWPPKELLPDNPRIKHGKVTCTNCLRVMEKLGVCEEKEKVVTEVKPARYNGTHIFIRSDNYLQKFKTSDIESIVEQITTLKKLHCSVEVLGLVPLNMETIVNFNIKQHEE